MNAEEFIRELPPTPDNGEVTVMAQDGAVVIRLKLPRPAWFRVWMGFALVLTPVIVGVAMLALATATAREAGDWTAISILELMAAAGAGMLGFVVLIVLLCWGLATAELTVGDEEFTGVSPPWLWRLPREDIRAVHLIHRPRSLDVDLSQPLRPSLRWVESAWVDLLTPGGTLRMVSGWSPQTQVYVAGVLASALKVRLEELDQANAAGAMRATARADGSGTRGIRVMRGATLCLLVAVPLMGHWIWSKEDAATHWPTVPGAVFRIDKQSREGSRLEYSYVVDSRRYNSSNADRTNPAIQRLIATGRVGQPVEVHYNPENPAEAALLPGVSPGILLFFVLLLGFVETLCLWLVVQAFKDRPTPATDALIARYRHARPPPKASKNPDLPTRPRKPKPPNWRVGLVATVASLVTGGVMYQLTVNAWRAGRRMSFESEEEIAPVFIKATLIAVCFSMMYFVLALLEWRTKRKAKNESE